MYFVQRNMPVKNKLILLTLRLFLCYKHGTRDSGKKNFTLHLDFTGMHIVLVITE